MGRFGEAAASGLGFGGEARAEWKEVTESKLASPSSDISMSSSKSMPSSSASMSACESEGCERAGEESETTLMTPFSRART